MNSKINSKKNKLQEIQTMMDNLVSNYKREKEELLKEFSYEIKSIIDYSYNIKTIINEQKNNEIAVIDECEAVKEKCKRISEKYLDFSKNNFGFEGI